MVYRKKTSDPEKAAQRKAEKEQFQLDEAPKQAEKRVNTRVSSNPQYWRGFQGIDERETWEKNKAKFLKARQREQKALTEMIFRYNGKLYSSYDMMEHIVMQTYEGYELPDILGDESDDTNELPTAKEVHIWLERHPNFKTQMEYATKYKAEQYNSMAVKAVTMAGYGQPGGPTRDQVAYAKLVSETFNRQAALNNDKFQEKTKHEVEDVTNKLTEEQLKQKLKELMKDPTARRAVEDAMGGKDALIWSGQDAPIDVSCDEEEV